jgi:hypothetical protein
LGLSRTARLTLLGGKSAKSMQLDALTPQKSVGDLVQNCVDQVLVVARIEVRIVLHHALHELRLEHFTPNNRRLDTALLALAKCRLWATSFLRNRPSIRALDHPGRARLSRGHTY